MFLPKKSSYCLLFSFYHQQYHICISTAITTSYREQHNISFIIIIAYIVSQRLGRGPSVLVIYIFHTEERHAAHCSTRHRRCCGVLVMSFPYSSFYLHTHTHTHTRVHTRFLSFSFFLVMISI